MGGATPQNKRKNPIQVARKQPMKHRHTLVSVRLATSLIAIAAAACDIDNLAPIEDDTSDLPAGFRARVAPDKSSSSRYIPANLADARIVVKFAEGTGIQQQGQSLRSVGVTPASGANAGDIADDLSVLLRAFDSQQMQLQPLFGLPRPALASLKQAGERSAHKELADLSLYFDAAWNGGTAAQLSAFLTELNALDVVEIAYVQPKPEVASIAAPDANTPNLSGNQGYVADNDNGIAVAAAHALAGGRGEHVRIIDVEGSWVEDHEDLPLPFYHGGTDSTLQEWENHGTAVAGVMVAQDNGFGVTGIVPDAGIGYSSIFGVASTAQAIINAADQLAAGDIILIELHAGGPDTVDCTCNFDQCNFVPMEFFQAEFDAIQTATANGIIVVEAAGNGSIDLDHPTYGGVFDRNVRDSGAIMVGASLSSSRDPACFTNHGNRIDLHGWGENVVTTGYGDAYVGTLGARDEYTSWFSGTSSASPIVVGAVAAIESIAIDRGEGPLTPDEVRDLLVDTGTPQGQGSLDRLIGPLPDLAEAIAEAGWDGGGGGPDVACDLNGGNASFGGFGIHNASVTNEGSSPIQGWSVEIDFGAGVPQPGWIWGATYSVSGNVVTVSGTGTLQPGQSANFGMGGNYSGPTQLSLSCE